MLVCVVFYFLVYVLSVFVILLGAVFVFFFKQKTAYEMRISDWSSDVCSSDLVHGLGDDLLGLADRLDRLAETDEILVIELGDQIGRASCRERVCQYV